MAKVGLTRHKGIDFGLWPLVRKNFLLNRGYANLCIAF